MVAVLVEIPEIIPEQLKMLFELRVIQPMQGSEDTSFMFTQKFMHQFHWQHQKTGSVTVGLNRAIDTHCPDLSKNESQQVKGTIVTLLTQQDSTFCREWLIERCISGAKWFEMKAFTEYVIAHNPNINEDKPKE